MTTTLDNIDKSCPGHAAMCVNWELIDDLLGGTLKMRERAQRWLPKEERESKDGYEVRLARTILYGALKDTIRRLRSKPFSQPVRIEGEAPEPIPSMYENVDGTGTDLTQFGAALFEDAAAHGLTHIFVDYAKVAVREGETQEEIAKRVRASEEQSRGTTPRFVHVKARDLIFWKTRPGMGGAVELAEVRIKECHAEDDEKGGGGQESVEYVRTLTPTTWELHRKKGGKWERAEGGTHTFGAVPLVTIYFQRTGFMTAEPPLQELAWLNLAHYQSDSDQRNILRFVRFGILFMAGVTDEEKKAGITIGPAKLIQASSKDAKLEVVEHTGKAVETGRMDLQDLEARMEMLGLQPLMSRTGDATATSQAIDESKSACDVQAWVRALERGLLQAFQMAAKWLGAKLPESFKPNIFSEFAIAARATEDVASLIKLQQAGIISKETALREVQRRSLVAETVDPKEELAAVEEEGPSLSEMGGGFPTPPGVPPPPPREVDDRERDAA